MGLVSDAPYHELCYRIIGAAMDVHNLKALSHLLTDEEVAQVVTYLAATGKPVGLLFNFGRRRLQFKRIFPPKKLDDWRDRIERYLWRPPDTRQWLEGQGNE